LSIILKTHERTIERDLDKLRKNHVLMREGGDRGGYWKIIADEK
jgi:predicted HTH transcriptional regulator